MLEKCSSAPVGKLDLPDIFKQLYAIKKKRDKEGRKDYTIVFPSSEARDRFMAVFGR